jgi:16S rRNA (guanine527-N7)-methyltransferase
LDHQLIFQYFPDLSIRQKEQFAQIGELYRNWNEKINLVSRKDIEELYVRHALHSLSIGKFVQFKPGTEILDVGTGGGFPGIPLAILFPETQFHLVDSISKKILVVKDITAAIGLENVIAEAERAEKINEKFDFIVTRAVAPAKTLWQWTQQKIKAKGINAIDNGIIALKGGDLKAEMKELKHLYQIRHIHDYFPLEFFETKKIVYIPR